MTDDPIEKAHLTGLRRERIRHRLIEALDMLVAHWPGAENPLKAEGSGRRTPPTSRPPLPAGPLSTRDAAWRDLRSWCQLVMEERDVTNGPRTTTGPDLALFLSRHADWIAAHPAADDCLGEVAHHARKIRDLDKGYHARRFQIGRCPEEIHTEGEPLTTPCTGNLWALMRQEAGLLPDRVLCDADEEHVWQPWQWAALGRRLGVSITEGHVERDVARMTNNGRIGA